jgi:hypothetical protein
MNASLPTQLTTMLASLSGICGVTANADTRGGPLAVELLDDRGYRLRAFDKSETQVITGVDSVAVPMQWKGARALRRFATRESRFAVI